LIILDKIQDYCCFLVDLPIKVFRIKYINWRKQMIIENLKTFETDIINSFAYNSQETARANYIRLWDTAQKHPLYDSFSPIDLDEVMNKLEKQKGL